MLVSHDRALLREVCDEFWLVTGGKVEPFDGDLDDYQKWLLDQSREAARAAKLAQSATSSAGKSSPVVSVAAAAPAAPVVAARSEPSPTASADPVGDREDRKAAAAARQQHAEPAKPVKKERAQVEQKLAAAQAQHVQLLEAMGNADAPPATRAEQGRRLKQLDDEIAALELRWLELGEVLEGLS